MSPSTVFAACVSTDTDTDEPLAKKHRGSSTAPGESTDSEGFQEGREEDAAIAAKYLDNMTVPASPGAPIIVLVAAFVRFHGNPDFKSGFTLEETCALTEYSTQDRIFSALAFDVDKRLGRASAGAQRSCPGTLWRYPFAVVNRVGRPYKMQFTPRGVQLVEFLLNKLGTKVLMGDKGMQNIPKHITESHPHVP